MQNTEPVLGQGKAAFKVACDLDLEGVVAKRLDDPYAARTKWWKILNRAYSQGGRAELFERRTASSATTHFPRTAACVTRRAISLSSSSHFRLGANS